jgi:GTP-binding protein
MFPVSGLTGKGTGDLLDYIAKFITDNKLNVLLEETNFGIGVAIVGKPNVGKSSLFNAIIKEERVIVSPIPGTTRAAIDTHIIIDQDDYTFIDTAGLKRKAYRQSQPDVFSGFQTFKSIRRSDVALLIIDATEEITKQDQHLAQEIWTLNKGLIIVANKIDVYEGEEQKLRDYISLHFPFLWMCPMILVSAKNGTGISDLVGAIKPIVTARHKELSDEELQRLLNKTLEHNPPKLMRDQKKPKVIGLKQVDTNPPIFELYVNYPAAISMQYRKFLEKSITRNLGFWGTPIKLRLKGKDKS